MNKGPSPTGSIHSIWGGMMEPQERHSMQDPDGVPLEAPLRVSVKGRVRESVCRI